MMRKVYFMVAMLLAGGTAFGQDAGKKGEVESPQPMKASDMSGKFQNNSKGAYYEVTPSGELKAAAPCHGDTIMHEDFANGLAGNTSFGAWDTTGAQSQYWEHDFDGDDGAVLGQPVPINSPTGGNGFMIYDLYNQTPGGFADEPMEGYLVTPVMDLSTYSYPRIEFYTYFVHCCNFDFNIEMEVSTDGGATWGQAFNVSQNIDRNVLSPNPLVLSYDLSTYLNSTSATNVQIRFSWDGSSADANGQYTSEYFWQIDDVIIQEANRNDVATDSRTSYVADSSLLAGSPNFFPIEYTMIPQCHRFTMNFGGLVYNVGQNQQTGVTMNVDINGPNTSYMETSTPTTVSPATAIGGNLPGYTPPEPDTVVASPGFYPPMDTGEYVADFYVSSDSAECVTSNDTGASETFYVTEEVLALDNAKQVGGVGSAIEAPGDGSGGYQDFTASNRYEFFKTDSIAYITYWCADTTEVGAGPVQGVVYDLGYNGVIASTMGNHYIQADDIGNWDTLWFANPFPVTKDSANTIGVSYAGGSLSFGVGQQGTAQGPLSLVEGDFGGSGYALYGSGEVNVVRLGMQNCLASGPSSIEENGTTGFNLGQNRPNPFDHNTVIDYKLDRAADVEFEVYDLTGKQVLYRDLGKRATGSHRIEVSASDLDAGVYYYTLYVGEQKATKKMVIME